MAAAPPPVVYVVLQTAADGATTVLSAYAALGDANAAVAAQAASVGGGTKVATDALGLAWWADAEGARCWAEKVSVVPDASAAVPVATAATGQAKAVEATTETEADAAKGVLGRSKSKLYVPEEADDEIVEGDDGGAMFA